MKLRSTNDDKRIKPSSGSKTKNVIVQASTPQGQCYCVIPHLKNDVDCSSPSNRVSTISRQQSVSQG